MLVDSVDGTLANHHRFETFRFKLSSEMKIWLVTEVERLVPGENCFQKKERPVSLEIPNVGHFVIFWF